MALVAVAACGETPVSHPRDGGRDQRVDSGAADAGDALASDAPAAALVFYPPSSSFDQAFLNQTGTAVTFQLRNLAEETTGPVAISLQGGAAADFVVSQDQCSGNTLAKNAGCTLVVTFVPKTVGARSSLLTAAATPGGTATAALTGSALKAAQLTLTPATADFGLVSLAGGDARLSFTAKNEGDVTTTAISTAVSGTDAALFSIATDGCAGQTLRRAATCTIVLAFDPDSAGAKAGSLTVSADVGGSASATVTGEGIETTLTSQPASAADFGGVLVGATSAPVIFTVTNAGTAPTGALSVSLGGTDPGEFQLGTENCSTKLLAAAETCTVAVTFAPSTRGARAARLNVGGTPGGVLQVALTGQAQLPATLAMAPAQHTFDETAVATASTALDLTVSNTGDQVTGGIATTLGGATAGDFRVVTDHCSGAALQPGASCHIMVELAPATGGAKTASLAVAATPGGTVTTSLAGSAYRPALLNVCTADPVMNPETCSAAASFDFGAVSAGTSSPEQTFAVANRGERTTGLLTATLGGTDVAEFAVSFDDCTASMLPAGASCTVRVRLSPTSSGTKAASLSVTSSPGGTATAGLTGTAL